MKKLRSLRVLALMIVGPLLASTAAKAGTLLFALTTPFQTSAAGDTVAFEATVADTGQTPLFLNGDSASLSGPLVLDDSLFLVGFPLSLNPGDSFTGELFTVSVLPGTPAGQYAGSFAILGGSEVDSQEVLGFVNFNVDVLTSNAVPDPSSLGLCVSGLAGLGWALRRRRCGR